MRVGECAADDCHHHSHQMLHWPGNVPELRNVLERAVILCDGGLITSDQLGLTDAAPAAPKVADVPAEASGTGTLLSMERAVIERALERARYNKSKAAKVVGLRRHQLYIRMRRYGLA
jgi:DNA-binding NtrC family response regulator